MIITKGTAEIIGALIGDGYIYRSHRKYQVGFVGSPLTDKEYFEYLKRLILQEWQKDVQIGLRERGLRMVLNSKEICNFLIDELDLAHGEGKCEKVKIPEAIYSDWNLARHTLRGIVDTDGSVFVARKPGIEKYPSIEITTDSIELAEQLRKILVNQNFRVANIRSYKSKRSRRITYKVPLNGKNNLIKWIKDIGFSNPYKLNRALEYTKK